MNFRELLKASLEDPEVRSEYRRVLEEELEELLRLLGQKGDSEEVPPGGLSLTLEVLARYAGSLGLSLAIEFRDEKGEVVGRFTLSPGEAQAV